MKIDKKHLLNYSILIPYMLLSGIGLIVVYSTTSPILIQNGLNSFRMVATQAGFWLFSLVMIGIIYRMKLDFLKRPGVITFVIIAEIILLLLSRFITGTINGAHGWLKIGPVTAQPAEYLKIILVWYLALQFSKKQEQIEVYDYQAITFNQLIPRAVTDWRVIVAFLIGLVVIMPDLGNATILLLTVLIVISTSGVAYRWFSTMLGAVVGGSAAVLASIWLIGVKRVEQVPVFGYVAKRFSAFFNPFDDLSGSGHQLAKSYYAMSNGGWFGLGLGNSIEKRGYLPEAHTDFILAIIAEELGLIGVLFVVALLLVIIGKVIFSGTKSRNTFSAMYSLGFASLLIVQGVVNIGGVTASIPMTGVPLPFISNGGSSILILSVGLGIATNILSHVKYLRSNSKK